MKTKKSKIVTIRVTRKDIVNGLRGRADSCPIAIACKRRLRNDVLVYEDSITIDGDGEFTTPRSAAQFVDRFDESKPVKPFSFKLKLTPEHREFLGL